MSRETRRLRTENVFYFPDGAENRSRLYWPDKWSAKRETFRPIAKHPADDKVGREAVHLIEKLSRSGPAGRDRL
jgi:hypothetical protein